VVSVLNSWRRLANEMNTDTKVVQISSHDDIRSSMATAPAMARSRNPVATHSASTMAMLLRPTL
jgi:hypothetical protein